MKKLLLLGGVVVALFAVIIILNSVSNKEKVKDNPYGTEDLAQATIDLLDDENYQSIVLPEAFEEKVQTGDTTFGYFFSPTCEHCKKFTPKLIKVANEVDVQINQINVLEYPDEWTKYNMEATPTFIYFKDGKEVNRIVGDYDEETVREFFANANIE